LGQAWVAGFLTGRKSQDRQMSKRLSKKQLWIGAGALVVTLAVAIYAWKIVDRDGWAGLLLTPDQQGRWLFQHERYDDAADTFRDPFWQATAWYRAGEFKKAAAIFMGFDTAEGAYNQGNAMAMQGKYKEAVSRYERALELKPEWEDAQVNLTIARQKAKALEQKGGEGTGGKLGADEIRFSDEKADDRSGGEETVEGAVKLSDAEMRTMWLRRVQTRPADFLRAKFAYQQAYRDPN
jgi:Ca-activated chloride channel family protein